MTRAAPIIRAPWNDRVAIKKIMDIGPAGVIIPWVKKKIKIKKLKRKKKKKGSTKTKMVFAPKKRKKNCDDLRERDKGGVLLFIYFLNPFSLSTKKIINK